MPTTLQDESAAQADATKSQPRPHGRVLVCLPPMAADTQQQALDAIAAAFPGEVTQVAAAISSSTPSAHPNLQLLTYPTSRADASWVLASPDYAAAAALAAEHNADSILLLSTDATALDPTLLRGLADCLRSKSPIDLALPRFTPGPTDGLVNSALLYPITRALFGADILFPLPIDAALSARMLQRLAATANRQPASAPGLSLLWPVAEAAIAGFSIRQVATPQPPPARPQQDDFNALFSSVTGALFTDIEAKAAFWQRARALPIHPIPDASPSPAPSADLTADIQPMIESFHLAQDNLQEIWSLVLPPQSRLALKKLSTAPASQFSLDPALWARIVYDFTLTFHLRTLNRGHLLGAMMPLYLAWVASHLLAVDDDATRANHRIEATAAAFETEKSYFVSRWRWPDRFNP